MIKKINFYNIFCLYLCVSSVAWFLAGIDESSRLFVYTFLLSPAILFVMSKRIVLMQKEFLSFIYAFFLLYLMASAIIKFSYWFEIDVFISLFRISIFPITVLLSFCYFSTVTNLKYFVSLIWLYMILALVSKIVLIVGFGNFYGGGANQIYFYPIYYSLLIYAGSEFYKNNSFIPGFLCHKSVRYIILFTIIILTLLSFKRMTIVLTIVSFILFIVSNGKNKNTFYLSYLLGGILLLLWLFIDIDLYFDFVDRMSSIFAFLANSESSVSGSLRMYENLSVISELNKLPLLSWSVGLGPGAEYEALIETLKRNASGRTVDVHSIYFYLLLNVGVVGVLAFFCPLIVSLRYSKNFLKAQFDRTTYFLLFGVKVTILMQFINGITSNAFLGDPMLALMVGWFFATLSSRKRLHLD